MFCYHKCHSFPIKYKFSSNNHIQASFVTVVPAVALSFWFSLFIYTHLIPILINQCLLSVVFSMAKALNGQSSPKQNFYFPHLSIPHEKHSKTLKNMK